MLNIFWDHCFPALILGMDYSCLANAHPKPPTLKLVALPSVLAEMHWYQLFVIMY